MRNKHGAEAGAWPWGRVPLLLRFFTQCDDQRFDSLGCAGNRLIQTPNIDRLAANGVKFRNHFVTTRICCVSRASIFTGQFQRRHNIGDFTTPFMPDQWKETYPALLRAASYRTGFIGKFGVGDAAMSRPNPLISIFGVGCTARLANGSLLLEQHNLATDPAQAAQLKHFESLLSVTRKRLGAPVDFGGGGSRTDTGRSGEPQTP